MELREQCVKILRVLAVCGCVTLLSYCSDPEIDPEPKPTDTDTTVTEITAPKLIAQAYRYDSIKLIFDKEVKQIYIASNMDVVSSNQLKFDASRKEVTFQCSYCAWGADYEFRFSVEGSNGKQSVDTTSFGFYFKKIALQGMVRKLYVDDSHEYFYLLTREPYRLNIFSVSEQRVIEEIPMDFLASFSDPKMSYNPGDGLFYFYSNAVPKIVGYSIASHAIEKTIYIKADPSSPTIYPRIYPYNVQFTSSGKAIAMMNEQYGYSQYACILTPYTTDTLIAELRNWQQRETSLHAGRDHDLVYLCTEYLEPPDHPYWRFHADGTIDAVQVPGTEGTYHFSHFIKPHQKNSLIYVASYYEQFILDEATGQASKVSYLDSDSESSADFSYSDEDENFVYFYESRGGRFHLLDYGNGKTVFEYGAIRGLQDLHSTFDGKFLIMYKEENLYMFSVEKIRNDNFNP